MGISMRHYAGHAVLSELNVTYLTSCSPESISLSILLAFILQPPGTGSWTLIYSLQLSIGAVLYNP